MIFGVQVGYGRSARKQSNGELVKGEVASGRSRYKFSNTRDEWLVRKIVVVKARARDQTGSHRINGIVDRGYRLPTSLKSCTQKQQLKNSLMKKLVVNSANGLPRKKEYQPVYGPAAFLMSPQYGRGIEFWNGNDSLVYTTMTHGLTGGSQ